MKGRGVLVLAVLTAGILNGCDFTERFINKPWGKGTYIPAAVCAVVGGVAGAAIESQGFSNESIRGGASSACTNTTGCQGNHDRPDYPASAAIGAGAGALLCGLAGHYYLDEEEKAPVPLAPELPPPTSQRIVLRGLSFFDFDKSDIRPDSRPVLDEAAEILRNNPEVRITVEGYTDSVGTDEYNQALSVRRAESIFRYLVNHGVAPERMQVVGYGKSHPLADNDTASGRAQNRRVELHIVDQSEPAAPPAGSEPGTPAPEPEQH